MAQNKNLMTKERNFWNLAYLLFITMILLLSTILYFNSSSRYTAPQDGMWNLPTASLLRGSSIYQNYISPLWYIHFFNWNIPIVSGPYIGVGKSYLLALTSLFFPTFASANLALNLVLLLSVTILTYLVCKEITGNIFALVSPVILFFSNGFMFAAQTDYGPFLFGTCGILLLALTYLKREHFAPAKYAYLLSFLIGATLADKLTIFPYLIPVAVYLLIYLYKMKFTNKLKVITLCITSLLLPLAFHIIYFLNGGWGELLAWLAPNGPSHNSGKIGLLQTWAALKTFSDVGFGGNQPYLYRAFFDVTNNSPSHISLLVTGFLILFSPTIILTKQLIARNQSKQLMVLCFYPLLVLSIMPIFSYNPWHLLPLTPFVIILGIQLISSYLNFLRRSFKWPHFGQQIFSSFFAFCLIFVSWMGVSNSYYYGNLGSFNAIGIASLDTKLIGQKLATSKISKITCLDYSVCLNVTANLPTNSVEIVNDYTFDSSFVDSNYIKLNEIVSCNSALLTRTYLKQNRFFSDQLVQGNSKVFFNKKLAEQMKFTQIAEIDIDGEKLIAWRKLDCKN